MNKVMTWLSGLLILQFTIAGLLFIPNVNQGDTRPEQSLIASDMVDVSEITISTADESLTLIKDDDWRVKDHIALPLASDRLSAVTTTLANAQLTWPVTTTSSSHERFKVAEDSYEKKVSFKLENGEQETIYLGTSPRFKQLYVRKANSDDVFSIEFSSYQLATDLDSWFDKSLLAVNDEIKEISQANIGVTKQDDTWQLLTPAKLPEGKLLNSDKISQLVKRFENIRVNKRVEFTPEQVENVIVKTRSDQLFTFAFAEHETQYLVNRSDIDYWFSLPKATYEELASLSPETVYTDAPADSDKTEQTVSKKSSSEGTNDSSNTSNTSEE
ncbi:DUF4340 domain-containing protein [Thalassotalea fusca]